MNCLSPLESTGSFSRNEIPLVRYVLGKAFEAMIEERGDNGEEPGL